MTEHRNGPGGAPALYELSAAELAVAKVLHGQSGWASAGEIGTAATVSTTSVRRALTLWGQQGVVQTQTQPRLDRPPVAVFQATRAGRAWLADQVRDR